MASLFESIESLAGIDAGKHKGCHFYSNICFKEGQIFLNCPYRLNFKFTGFIRTTDRLKWFAIVCLICNWKTDIGPNCISVCDTNMRPGSRQTDFVIVIEIKLFIVIAVGLLYAICVLKHALPPSTWTWKAEKYLWENPIDIKDMKSGSCITRYAWTLISLSLALS